MRAWLADNPDVESRIAHAGMRYDRRDMEGDTPIVRLADHLRRLLPGEPR